MISFNKIVNKLSKRRWKVIFKKDIFEIIDPEQKTQYQNQLNKIIYRLRSEWIIKTIKNWVYIIPQEEDFWLNEIDLIDKYYFPFLKKLLSLEVWGEYFISWKKSLEFHLKNFSVPEKIFIINRKVNKKIYLWEKVVILKTISQKWKNLFNKFIKYCEFWEIQWEKLRFSCLELSLLESTLIQNEEEWIDVILINQALKKYKNHFKGDVFYEIWELKYIMAFNRLKELVKNIQPDLYEIFLDIIKKNGGLFIGEWLRRI